MGLKYKDMRLVGYNYKAVVIWRIGVIRAYD